MTLGEFLKSQLANHEPWNCSTFAADWCIALGHPDYAAAWRDIVEPDLCDTTARRAGGLLSLWDQGIGAALCAVHDLQAGDIAIVAAHGIEAGAIWTGERWVIRAARGLHWFPAEGIEMLKAWRP